MKIAVLTQPLGTNYGGALQAWALQYVLREMGHSAIVIDRQFDRRGSAMRRWLGQVKRLAHDGLLAVRGKALYGRHAEYLRGLQTRFLQDKLVRSEPLHSDAGLRRYFARNRFDAVIVGSDQVWRPRYSPLLETYFLDFLSAKQLAEMRCFAYAASFGVGHWELSAEQTARCRALAKRFDEISVREESGIELCKEHLGVSAEWVVDPTLLLHKEDYVREFCPNTGSGGRGLLTYVLDEDPAKSDAILKLEDALGLQRFSCQAKPPQNILERTRLQDFRMPSTCDWVRSFHEADYVVTDSFHGTVFAIIFRKPFVAIANSSRGSERFTSLLGALGLQHRLLASSDSVDLAMTTSRIDYSHAEMEIGALRAASLDYLQRNLGGRK